MKFRHETVLLQETVNCLKVNPDGIYVDGTVGGGGHALAVCRLLGERGSIVGIDQDEEALGASAIRLKDFMGKVTLVRSNYCNMESELKKKGILSVDGILLDLGVSSHQLDAAERGFSYRLDAALDMRMDKRKGKTARDVVNGYDEKELCRVIREYGEERFAARIAEHIVMYRARVPIETTGELVSIIDRAIPMKAKRQMGHPAKRTFQAIRIEVNDELAVLKDSLDTMIGLLRPGGRLCVISFHSLEDRIVKQAFRNNENPCTCPANFPKCVCGNVSKGRVITKKPIVPGKVELAENTRAKSAKLRVFERT